MDATSPFASALQLPDPWMASGVKFRDGTDGGREPRIAIGFRTGPRFHRPEEARPAHDARERVRRHSSFFRYQAFIHADVEAIGVDGTGGLATVC